MDRSHGEFSAQVNVGYVVSELSNDMSDVAEEEHNTFWLQLYKDVHSLVQQKHTQRAAHPQYSCLCVISGRGPQY